MRTQERPTQLTLLLLLLYSDGSSQIKAAPCGWGQWLRIWLIRYLHSNFSILQACPVSTKQVFELYQLSASNEIMLSRDVWVAEFESHGSPDVHCLRCTYVVQIEYLTLRHYLNQARDFCKCAWVSLVLISSIPSWSVIKWRSQTYFCHV